MLAQNPHADLLSLQADSAAPDCLTLTLRCGIESFEVLEGAIVRVGLTGFQLTLQSGAVSPLTIAGVPLLQAIQQSLAQRWPSCSHFLTENTWSGFSTAVDGFHQEPFYGAIDLAEIDLAETGANSTDFALTGTIGAADLRILEANGLWHHDIPPNNHGILERVVLKALLQTLPQPICSLAGDRATWSPQISPASTASNLVGEERNRLHHQIVELSQSTLDFLTLLRLSQLDPRTDLVGINLLGGDLRNMDISNANLGRSNLRGADLSDADLTEANLSYARLSGADLSGALLSNADLRGANVHRASLALANLSGADLRQADLRGANLSQVSLSGAKVQGLRWGENEGLSASVEAYLNANGAILDPLS